MYSKEEFKNTEFHIQKEAPRNCIKKIEENCKRQEQLVYFYRSKILYRNHDTNNYTEASTRILKDILFNRTELKIIQFCGFI